MVWLQSGAKFSGLTVKLTSFDSIVSLIGELIVEIPLSSEKTNLELASQNFDHLLREFLLIRNNLSKSFNFIDEIIASPSDPAPAKTQVGRITSLFSAVTKNVRKYAEVGYNRIGALSTKASSTEINQYYNSICILSESCQVI